jgi:hypothetical protein
LIKGSIHQEDMAIANIYALNMGPPRYRKET